jgi:hypothetical protein
MADDAASEDTKEAMVRTGNDTSDDSTGSEGPSMTGGGAMPGGSNMETFKPEEGGEGDKDGVEHPYGKSEADAMSGSPDGLVP